MLALLRKHDFALVVICILVGAIAGWLHVYPKWYGSYARSVVSPDGRYRVDRWNAGYFTGSDYGFERIYNNRTGEFMCEGDVQWRTDNGRIDFPAPMPGLNRIEVGGSLYELNEDGTRCTYRELDNTM